MKLQKITLLPAFTTMSLQNLINIFNNYSNPEIKKEHKVFRKFN